MVNIEPSVDTSTWIASTLALNTFPDKIWTLFNYTDSRPFTVLPLYLVSLFGVSINYISTEIIGLVLWICTGLILNKTFQLFLTKELGLLLTWFLWMVIGTTWHFDHIAYNSEHIGILAITLCSYWYLKFRKSERIEIFRVLVLGLCLGCLPYIKFQNIPMGIVIAAFTMLAFIKLKNWKALLVLITGGVLPTILINFYFWTLGKLSDFWVNYFWNYFYYSYSTQFQSMPVNERFSVHRTFFFLLNSANTRLFIGGLLGGIVILAFWWFRSKKDSFAKVNLRFSGWLLLTSLYATLQAGNNFDHYVLYLFVPLIYITGVLVGGLNSKLQSIAVASFITLILIQSIVNITTRHPSRPVIDTTLDDKIVKEIQANSTAQQSIVIWGWVDRLYYLSGRANGYRFPYTYNLFLESELHDYRVINFLEDLEARKPELIIDIMIPTYSMNTEIGGRFEDYPKISKYIHQHYRYLKNVEGVLFYIKKHGD